MGAFADLDVFILGHCRKQYRGMHIARNKKRIEYLINENLQGRKPYDLLDQECQEILKRWEDHEEATLSGIGR